mmetsp:Transcript_87443/g.234164  ORF Transcript_87443/g.234164 Transcript_87443/m.234164 type:complete len:205 (-) Transcript_87443:997-1611(-)
MPTPPEHASSVALQSHRVGCAAPRCQRPPELSASSRLARPRQHPTSVTRRYCFSKGAKQSRRLRCRRSPCQKHGAANLLHNASMQASSSPNTPIFIVRPSLANKSNSSNRTPWFRGHQLILLPLKTKVSPPTPLLPTRLLLRRLSGARNSGHVWRWVTPSATGILVSNQPRLGTARKATLGRPYAATRASGWRPRRSASGQQRR